uniref:Putative ovule protein n=1 Tax=Solanum chacoense TaxID=4108 RepID=A0A0V0I7H9_SOLCH
MTISFFDLDVRINCGASQQLFTCKCRGRFVELTTKRIASMSNFESHGNKVRTYHKLNIFAFLHVFKRKLKKHLC